MGSRRSAIRVVLIAALLAGCATQPTPQATPTPPVPPSPSPSSVAPSSTSSSPSSSASASPVIPSASPIGTPVPPSPTATPPGGFLTPVPPSAASIWSGIRWRKLAKNDPLAHVQSMTRWRGGYVAVGDLAASGDTAHSKIWTSADGATSSLLGADVFGTATIVVGMAATAEGLVALTLQSGMNFGGGDPNPVDAWVLTGPLQSWTSSDGTSWTAHPGPDITLGEMDGADGDHPILQGGTAGHLLAVTQRGQPVAMSTDGIAWQAVPAKAFPKGFHAQATVALSTGFLAVGSTPTKGLAMTSTDGRAWTSHAFPVTCPLDALTLGPAGIIATGEFASGGTGITRVVWCSSLDGRSWLSLAKYPPLGVLHVNNECDKVCPNGILVGNGERMFAYRGYGAQVAWTSFDGRTWKSVALMGSRPTGWVDASHPLEVVLLPIGVVLHEENGTTIWFGQPST